jgi:hypothetical protein
MSAPEIISAPPAPPPPGGVPEVSPGSCAGGALSPATYPFGSITPAVAADICARAREVGIYFCRGLLYHDGTIVENGRTRLGRLAARELTFLIGAARRGMLKGHLLRVDRVRVKPTILADGHIVTDGFHKTADRQILAVHAAHYPRASQQPPPLDAGATMFSDRASAAVFYAATAFSIAPELFETPPPVQVVGDHTELAIALIFATARGSAPPQAIDTWPPHEEPDDDFAVVLDDLDVLGETDSDDLLRDRLVINATPRSEPRTGEIRLRRDFAPSARVAAAALELALDRHAESFMTIASHVSALVRRARAPITWADAIEWFGRQIDNEPPAISQRVC